jgi:hypothetical protein
MVPFDMAVSFAAGQTLSYSARQQLKEEKAFLFNRPHFISVLWMALLYAPSAMFFYHGWTAWNIVYIFDPDKTVLKDAIFIWLDCAVLALVTPHLIPHTALTLGRHSAAGKTSLNK